MWIKTFNENYVNGNNYDFIEWRSISLDNEVFCYEVFLLKNNGEEYSLSCFKKEVEAEDYMQLISVGKSELFCNHRDVFEFLDDILKEKEELPEYSDDMKNFDDIFDIRRNYANKIINSKRIQYGADK